MTLAESSIVNSGGEFVTADDITALLMDHSELDKRDAIYTLSDWRRFYPKWPVGQNTITTTDKITTTYYNRNDIIRWAIHEKVLTSIPDDTINEIKQRFSLLRDLQADLENIQIRATEKQTIRDEIEQLTAWFAFESIVKNDPGEGGNNDPSKLDVFKEISAQWDDVAITLKEEQTIVISAKGKHHSVHAQQLSLWNRKIGNWNADGTILIEACQQDHACLIIKSGPSEASVKRIRKTLTSIFPKIEGDPFSNVRTKGWKPAFKLINGFEQQRKRAEKDAKYSTESLSQTSDERLIHVSNKERFLHEYPEFVEKDYSPNYDD